MECKGRAGACDALTAKQFEHALARALGAPGELVACERRASPAGLAGFLGEHARLLVTATVGGRRERIGLFVKSIPRANAPKAEFIEKSGYYKREALALRLAEEMGGAEGPNPWCARVYLCSESVLVMPDLTLEGYRTLRNYETLDLAHAMSAAASLARFHASFADYASERAARDQRPYDFLGEHGHVVTEPTFCDSPWLRAAAKLTCNLLKEFSELFDRLPQELEPLLVRRYAEACAALAPHAGTLNVMLHKDLWVNNIMFKYAGGRPAGALLIDFQCLRYGPPAFDLMGLLYLTTDRSFRERHEADVVRHYLDVFSESASAATRARLRALGYGRDALARWCERGRLFALFQAIGILPYVLMEPERAQQTFDDPATFVQHNDVDRTAPVLACCRHNAAYCHRQLEVCEEFMQRYVLEQTP